MLIIMTKIAIDNNFGKQLYTRGRLDLAILEYSVYARTAT